MSPQDDLSRLLRFVGINRRECLKIKHDLLILLVTKRTFVIFITPSKVVVQMFVREKYIRLS